MVTKCLGRTKVFQGGEGGEGGEGGQGEKTNKCSNGMSYVIVVTLYTLVIFCLSLTLRYIMKLTRHYAKLVHISTYQSMHYFIFYLWP